MFGPSSSFDFDFDFDRRPNRSERIRPWRAYSCQQQTRPQQHHRNRLQFRLPPTITTLPNPPSLFNQLSSDCPLHQPPRLVQDQVPSSSNVAVSCSDGGDAESENNRSGRQEDDGSHSLSRIPPAVHPSIPHL